MEELDFRFYSSPLVAAQRTINLFTLYPLNISNMSLGENTPVMTHTVPNNANGTDVAILITALVFFYFKHGFWEQCVRELLMLFTAGFIGGLFRANK